MKAFILSMVFVLPAFGLASYEVPSCEALTEKWVTQYSIELRVTYSLKTLDLKCQGTNAQVAFAAHHLKKYLPSDYLFLTQQVRTLTYGGKSQDHTLADADETNGTITVYDSLLEQGREYIAAQLVHEAAHLRKGNIDPHHVTCNHGLLKDQEGACAEKYTGQRAGDAYNYTYAVLVSFFRLSEEHEDIDRDAVVDELHQLVRNSFNQIPESVVEQWLAVPEAHPGDVPIPVDKEK